MVNQPINGKRMEKEAFKQANQEYKRTRKFLDSWKKDNSWLEHDDIKNEMFCSLCRKYSEVVDRTGSFFLGMQSFRT